MQSYRHLTLQAVMALAEEEKMYSDVTETR